MESARKSEHKSAISGTGYGSDHCWVRGETAQVGSDDSRKRTDYRCATCGELFTHRYAAIRDIFEAMRSSGVTEHCAGSSAPRNLAARLPGWADWSAEQQATREKMPLAVHSILLRYIQNSATDLSWTTFRHIAAYFATGTRGARLEVACADFGYTFEELEALRGAGKTAKDVASEIVGRGVDDS